METREDLDMKGGRLCLEERAGVLGSAETGGKGKATVPAGGSQRECPVHVWDLPPGPSFTLRDLLCPRPPGPAFLQHLGPFSLL